MERTMLALWGISNVGKTTTIRMVYEELRAEADTICITPGLLARKEVKAAILEIDGVLVGFASQGDFAEILRERLEPLIEAGCSVILCATHTRGGTVDIVTELAESSDPPYKLVWIRKSHGQADEQAANRQGARKIIAEIRKAISSAQLVEA